jgi:hypothetical protein
MQEAGADVCTGFLLLLSECASNGLELLFCNLLTEG